MKNRDYGNLLGYVDICMNLMVGFIALFVFALMLIKVQDPQQQSKSVIDTNGKLIIHLTWDNESSNDIDLWVRTNNPDATVSFRSKDQINMILDNDNLGKDSHKVEMGDGTIKNTFGNNENVMLKECTNTHVTVNVHVYSVKNLLPVKTVVELISPKPYKVIYTRQLVLTTKGQELTAFSFDLDENCNITNISEVFVPFVYGGDMSPELGGQLK